MGNYCGLFLIALLLVTYPVGFAGAFVPGNIFVTRVGTGAAALSTSATAVFLDEFTPAGNLVNSLALPTAASGGNQALTLSGTATSEGVLRRSVDGRYLTLAGYAAVPGTANVSSTPSTAVNRVIARVDSVGVVDTSTRIVTAFSGGNIRGVVSNDGAAFWATGSNSGMQYVPFGMSSAGTQISGSPLNVRVPGIFGGQLYVSSATSMYYGVSSIGVGLPTSAGQTTTLPGFPTAAGPSPYGFVMFDMNPNVAGIDTIYITDDRSPVSGGGIQKWTFNGTTWTLVNTLNLGLTVGVRGVTGYVNSSNNVVLYATTTETSANKLVTVTDDGVGTFMTLVTASANTVYRSVELTPSVTLGTSTAGTGSGTILGVHNPYSVGGVATITAEPSPGSFFANWSECSASTAVTIDVLMDTNKTCIANFTLKLDQTISFGVAPTVYVGGTGVVSATSTSGLVPSYRSDTTDICTIDGTTVSGIKTGTCTIAADQAGDSTHNAALQVTQSFPVILTHLPATENVGANMSTLVLKSSATGTGYFTLLKGSGTTCGTGPQVKAGQDSTGATSPYHGSLPLAANVDGRYTVRNLLQSTAYTACFTADSPSGQNLQEVPATVNFSTSAPAALTNPNWSVLGTGDVSTGWANFNSLAFAPNGVPHVVFSDAGQGYSATVMMFDGASWSPVGLKGFTPGWALNTVLAFSPDGIPYVAFSGGGNDWAPSVMKFSDGNWSFVGNAGFYPGVNSSSVSLTFSQAGVPYVAFQDTNFSAKATVMSFNGSEWTFVGEPGFTSWQAQDLSLAFAPDDTPYISFRDWSQDGKATVMKYSSGIWNAVGITGFSSGQAYGTVIRFSPEGVPFVAYSDDNNGYKAAVRKFDGAAWVAVGDAGISGGLADYISLAFSADGLPMVAFRDVANDTKTSVMKFDGVVWNYVGSAGFTTGEPAYISLGISPDGVPTVVFTDTNANGKSTVMKLSNGSVISLSQDTNPTDLEQQVTFTATVAPPTATGTVTFKDGTTTLCPAVPPDVNHQASCTVSSLAMGTHIVSASYSDDAGLAGSIARVEHLVMGKVLLLGVNGTGGDLVTITRNPKDGHPAIHCGVGTCQVVFPSNASLTLTPAFDVLSVSAAWDGNCAGSTVCSVTMDSDKSLVATFNLTPVANVSINVPYATLTAAVAGARQSGDEIRMLNVSLGDASVVTLDRSVILRGGWLNYQAKDAKPTLLNTGLTVLGGDSRSDMMVVKGKLAIQGGSLRVQEVQVQP